MNLYLDTEFDGHGGPLISLALAAPHGEHWYGIPPRYFGQRCNSEWVEANVIPKLAAMPGTARFSDINTLRASLRGYLTENGGATIWADWPDDFAHLMRLMSGPSYGESFMIPCTMQLIVTPDGEPKPEIPHNALSDAIALMQWHQNEGAAT